LRVTDPLDNYFRYVSSKKVAENGAIVLHTEVLAEDSCS
jgi:hypothetical protein